MLHQGLTIKGRVHKFGVTNVACRFCGRDEVTGHVFWRLSFTKTCSAWANANFKFLIITSLFQEGSSSRVENWMIRVCYTSL